MKRLFYIISLLAIVPLFFIKCDSEDNLTTGDAKEGGLVDVLTPSLNYVVGNSGTYSFSLRVYQGGMKTTKAYLYKSFYSVNDDTAGGDAWSNEVLQSTLNITTQTNHQVVSPDYSYADLISDLKIHGNNLPSADNLLSIGDAFYFRIVTETSDGRKSEQDTKVKLTVATRFAGKYKTLDAAYYRIGVFYYGPEAWPAELTIESVDAKTYKMVEYLGPFDGNTLYFQIEADGTITYPAQWAGADQLLNGQPMITCVDNATDFVPEVHCGASDYIVKDDVGGKDKLIMTIGYYTAGSGPRVFYQELEKIVE
jgi:hypothetical protein